MKCFGAVSFASRLSPFLLATESDDLFDAPPQALLATKLLACPFSSVGNSIVAVPVAGDRHAHEGQFLVGALPILRQERLPKVLSIGDML